MLIETGMMVVCCHPCSEREAELGARGAGGPRAVLLARELVHILQTASEERFRLSLAFIPRCRTPRPPLRRGPLLTLGSSRGKGHELRDVGEKPDLLSPLCGRGVCPERDAW